MVIIVSIALVVFGLLYHNAIPLFFCEADYYEKLYEDGKINEGAILDILPKLLGHWGNNKRVADAIKEAEEKLKENNNK